MNWDALISASRVISLFPVENLFRRDPEKRLDKLEEELRRDGKLGGSSQKPEIGQKKPGIPLPPSQPQKTSPQGSQGFTKQVPGHWCISCGTNKHLALSPLLDEAAERWDDHRDIATQKINRIVEHVNTYENDDLAMEPRFEELKPKQEELKSSLAELRHSLLPLQYGEGTKQDIEAAKGKLSEAQRKATEAGALERKLERGETGEQMPEVVSLKRFIEEREGQRQG